MGLRSPVKQTSEKQVFINEHHPNVQIGRHTAQRPMGKLCIARVYVCARPS
jgi:hypothetical protein